MTSGMNLSVGQRLAVGFGTLLAILAVFVFGVGRWQQQSLTAQTDFTAKVAPRVEAARALERELLYVGISVRRYLLSLDAAALGQAELRLTRVRRAYTTLEERANDLGHREILARMSAFLEAYIGEAVGMMDTAVQGRVPERELALDYTRERVLDTLREFIAREDEQSRAALQTITTARDQSARAVNYGSLALLLGFVVIAGSTAHAVAKPTRELVRIAGALQAGDWGPAMTWAPRGDTPSAAPVRSEWRRVAVALGSAAAELQRRERGLHAAAAVASAVSSSLEPREVALATLRAVADYAQAPVGVVYWRQGDQLEPIGSLGLDAQVAPVAVGDGLPGAAVRSRQRVTLRDIPGDSGFTVRVGFDQATPKHVVAVPATFGGTVHGVVVVAGLRAFSPDVLSFLDATGAQLGVALQNLRTHAEIQTLLVETQQQAERIQSQSEELEAQHEELQAQHAELQVQTEQIQAQREELEAQYEQLSHSDRTLREQAQLLTEADTRKDEFLAWLAHELRNPMAPITTSLHVLRRVEPGGEPAQRALAVIERQSRHLVRLIDDLLDITRISHGKIEIRRERVDFARVVRDGVEDQATAATARGMRVEVVAPQEPVWVDGDRTRLAQVVGNLLNNALKFTDEGGRITVTVRPDATARRATLSVCDTGIGLDASLQPRLFKPFSQGPATLARSRGGLGLGLALVKALVDLHGGTVFARSDGPGRGTEVVVTLPLADANTDARPANGARRVLVIEDNVDAAQGLQAALELAGHRAEVAFTAADGLQRALAAVPDAIICDVGLPGMDGYALARRLRAEPRLQHTLLVALTGYAGPRDRQGAIEAGFHHHLSKPTDVDEVLRLLAAASSIAAATDDSSRGTDAGHPA